MKLLTATIAGHTYEIPEIWILGFCHFGRTPFQAIEHWHEQELAGEEFEKQRPLHQDECPECGADLEHDRIHVTGCTLSEGEAEGTEER